MTPCHLLVVPGGDPSPIAGMIWALRKHQQLDVKHLHLIFYEEAHKYYQLEFIGGDNPARQLHEQGWSWEAHTHLARTSKGSPLQDDTKEEDAQRFVELIWTTAKEAQDQAGSLPVIFGLLGGRRRTLTVDITLVFQLLARPQDQLFDIRPVPKEVSGPGSGFFFPTQSQPTFVYDTHDTRYSPQQIQLDLVSVRVPRLRPLLNNPPDTFADALHQSEVALLGHDLPHLTIDLSDSKIILSTTNNPETEVPANPNTCRWYAGLALAAQRGTPYVAVNNPTILQDVLARCTLAQKKDDEQKEKEALYKLFCDPTSFEHDRTLIKRALRKAVIKNKIPNGNMLIPQTKRLGDGWSQYIDLPASHIHFL